MMSVVVLSSVASLLVPPRVAAAPVKRVSTAPVKRVAAAPVMTVMADDGLGPATADAAIASLIGKARMM